MKTQSLTSRALCAVLRAVFHSRFVQGNKLSDNAAKIDKNIKSRYKPSSDFVFTRHKCKNCFYEKLTPKSTQSETVILMIHGGSFKIGLNDKYRRLAEKYSRMFGDATIINADYRIFPQYEHPCQLYDIADIYLELLNQGIDNKNIIFLGDSAGANLAVTTTLYLRDNAQPLPLHVVCFSLWADMTSSGESRIKNAYLDPFGGIARHKAIEDNWEYLHRISAYAVNADRESPYLSPVFASFHSFPKTTLVCGGAEMDESDNDRVYAKIKAEGIDVALYKFEGMFHCFQLIGFLPESKTAYKKVIERIKEK